jgi:VanZ family protein
MNDDRRPTPGPRHRAYPGLALFLGWLTYLAFVVYGSLVPLDFQPRPWDEAWRLFQHIRLLDVGAQGRADWIANGVLYLPLAFLTAHVLAGRRARPSALALVLALLFSLTLAVAVEFVQLHFPPRTVSLNDLLAEGIGSLLGVALAAAWGGASGACSAPWPATLRSSPCASHRPMPSPTSRSACFPMTS